MANNKVQLADGTTLIDLTEDTVTPETLIMPYTAHNASGEKINGEFDPSIFVKEENFVWQVGSCTLSGPGTLVSYILRYLPLLKLAYFEFQINGFTKDTVLTLNVSGTSTIKPIYGFNNYNSVIVPIDFWNNNITFAHAPTSTALVRAAFFFMYNTVLNA